MLPVTNSGIEIPSSDRLDSTRSIGFPRLRAASVPSPTPMSKQRCATAGRWSTALAGVTRGAAARPRIVLRSSWQTINIGDIGHTPGVLAILERHLPEAEVILWPMNVENGVEAMLLRRFPKLVITRDKDVVRGCDFLLHANAVLPVAIARAPTLEDIGIDGGGLVERAPVEG